MEWTAPRTADGRPDLSGIWANDSATPLERPEGFEGKPELTPEEFAALKERADELSRTSSDAPFFGEVFRAATSDADEFESICAGTGNHNAFWLPAREFEARTSLIVDPPDGRIPYTPEARENLAAQARQFAGNPASWEQLPLITRCITNGVPNLPRGQPWTGEHPARGARARSRECGRALTATAPAFTDRLRGR